ncbi:MAG: C69 family dipeptidase [Bacteroidota bacterium]
MSDIFVAPPLATKNGSMILGKNSDREPNEAQTILRIPAKVHKASLAHTTFTTVPQVSETYEMILCKPFNIWGAEMGVNEHQLAVANTQVYTKVGISKDNKELTGPDLVRLALERCTRSFEALELLIELIETYGQDAYDGYERKSEFHHNSFVMADPEEAYLLETAGREWVAVKLWDFYSVANALSVETEYDYSSKNLISYAKKQGWYNANSPFNFKKVYTDRILTYSSRSFERNRLAQELMEGKKKNFTIEQGMDFLSSISESAEIFEPRLHGKRSISMYASGWDAPHQTNGSMVVELHAGKVPTIWMTATSSPDISIFKPFFFPGRSIMEGEWHIPSAKADDSLWWSHERLHRLTQRYYGHFHEYLATEKSQLQQAVLEHVDSISPGQMNSAELDKLSYYFINQHQNAIMTWIEKVKEMEAPSRKSFRPVYQFYWNKQNKSAEVFS